MIVKLYTINNLHSSPVPLGSGLFLISCFFFCVRPYPYRLPY